MVSNVMMLGDKEERSTANERRHSTLEESRNIQSMSKKTEQIFGQIVTTVKFKLFKASLEVLDWVEFPAFEVLTVFSPLTNVLF